jgi:hypothetical protein
LLAWQRFNSECSCVPYFDENIPLREKLNKWRKLQKINIKLDFNPSNFDTILPDLFPPVNFNIELSQYLATPCWKHPLSSVPLTFIFV